MDPRAPRVARRPRGRRPSGPLSWTASVVRTSPLAARCSGVAPPVCSLVLTAGPASPLLAPRAVVAEGASRPCARGRLADRAPRHGGARRRMASRATPHDRPPTTRRAVRATPGVGPGSATADFPRPTSHCKQGGSCRAGLRPGARCVLLGGLPTSRDRLRSPISGSSGADLRPGARYVPRPGPVSADFPPPTSQG